VFGIATGLDDDGAVVELIGIDERESEGVVVEGFD
jgi:hypothetical protein